MNKYIKAVFCVPLAGIKYAILKIENGGRFHAAFPAIMSPMTEVTVDGKSELHIARKLKMHNGAKIRVRKGGKLEIGKNFGMSNGCVVTAYDHIKIGDNVMLGPNVLIYRNKMNDAAHQNSNTGNNQDRMFFSHCRNNNRQEHPINHNAQRIADHHRKNIAANGTGKCPAGPSDIG